MLRKVINAPIYMHPVALIVIGYFSESSPARDRKPVSEIILKETF
jgi:hypothetical protein